MKCRCGKYGIYWRNLHTGNPYTCCPHCLSTNCQEPEFTEDDIEHAITGD